MKETKTIKNILSNVYFIVIGGNPSSGKTRTWGETDGPFETRGGPEGTVGHPGGPVTYHLGGITGKHLGK